MKKLLIALAATIALSSPVSAQTILAANIVGPVGQLNLLTVQQANQLNLAGLQVLNVASNQAVGNAAGVSQTNDASLLTANVQLGITQVNALTVQQANQANIAVIQLANTFNNSAIGNLATVDQVNGPLAFAALNLQTGITQLNVGTVQQANQVNAAVVQGGNTMNNAAAGNVANISSIN